MPKLFVYGFPGLYGGAATELRHQIHCWRTMGQEVEIIPSMRGHQNEPLRDEMMQIGVRIHEYNQFDVIEKDDAIINFCSKEFLESLPAIKQFTNRTMFANCMTFLFTKENGFGYEKNEGWNHFQRNIALSLYQRPQVRDIHKRVLREKYGSTSKFVHFSPYYWNTHSFDDRRDFERFTLGRISRQDADKFTKNLWHIWEYIASPVFKRGICLGWDDRSREVCGTPPDWVECYPDHNSFPLHRFWSETNAIVQPTRTNENWPRIGFEAMYSGVPLIVDRRAGWTYMVEHGVTGFLCDHERDFIYYASKLAYEPEFRATMARAALAHAESLSSFEVSSKSWENVFELIFNL